jgi:hypothetical protein
VSSGHNIFTPGTPGTPGSNLIGQPFYKGRPILGRVASVAGSITASTLVHLGRVPSLGQPRPGNPVEGNGRDTRLKGLSHRIAGLVVNCPLPGPPGLRSSLGGEAASNLPRGGAVCLYSAHCTNKLVSSRLFVQCILYKQTGFL